ncbi:MAG TPA: glycosyltransferase family 2 protein [Polyangiaceae bacterium]|nr:glycosyltransferase family 2 protein [Polyangiaceae bacterium]
MTICVLMPVFNEGSALVNVLRDVRGLAGTLGGVEVILVDDASQVPLDAAALPAPTSEFSFVLARHEVNLGQGAALETARQLALARGPFEAFVTMDADGQHRPEDLIVLLQALRGGADVVFGDRFRGESNVPMVRAAVLRVAALFERSVTGLELRDAHNGFRALSRRAIELCPITQGRMAHATEIKQRVAAARRTHGLRVVEVPVSIRYSTDSLRKGQSSWGAVTILKDLVFRSLFGDGTP